MSLILDALRKSEAERRRGNLPALALELPPAPPDSVPSRAWWLAIPVVLALAALAFWATRSADLPPPARPTAVPLVETPPTPQPVHAPPIEPVTRDVTAVADPPPAHDPMPADALPAASTPEPGPAPAPAGETREIPGPGPVPILALADLTPDERRALPPLKLSMHMWSQAPADRFVILDGHRLGEGDRAGSAVVQRIDPDGVILAADGRRIRLPLP